MSRLDFVPSRKKQQVNLEEGTLSFAPVAGKRIDVRRLVKRIEDAGYKVRSIEISITGKLSKWNGLSAIEDANTGQFFVLQESAATGKMFNELGLGTLVRITGDFSHNTEGPKTIAVKQFSRP